MTLLEAEKSTAALPEAGASSLLLPKTGTSSSLDACAVPEAEIDNNEHYMVLGETLAVKPPALPG